MADTPAQPVVGYVGYALREPWGQPRAVIGFSAEEAERLAEFLEHGSSATPPALPAQPSARQRASGQSRTAKAQSAAKQAGKSAPAEQATPGEQPAPVGQPAPEDQPTLVDVATAKQSLYPN